MTTLTHQDRMHLIGLIRNGEHPKNVGSKDTDKGREMRHFMQTWQAEQRLANLGGIGCDAKRLTSLIYPDRIEVYDIEESCDIPLIISEPGKALVSLMRRQNLFPIEAVEEVTDDQPDDGSPPHPQERFIEALNTHEEPSSTRGVRSPNFREVSDLVKMRIDGIDRIFSRVIDSGRFWASGWMDDKRIMVKVGSSDVLIGRHLSDAKPTGKVITKWVRFDGHEEERRRAMRSMSACALPEEDGGGQ